MKEAPSALDAITEIKGLSKLPSIHIQEPSQKPKFSLALGSSAGVGGDSKVPSLDFSNLKHIKDNDWYAYSKKLEDVI
jgi:hypothetical protein